MLRNLLRHTARILLCLCLLPLLHHVSPCFGAPADPQAPRLLKVVALADHGVHAPALSAALLGTWTERHWPVWPVERGELTPRGAALIRDLWTVLRSHYQQLGLLPQHTSPAAIYVRADNTQRCRGTATSLLEALLPQSSALSYAIVDAMPDPLFHPVRTGQCVFNIAETASDVLQNMDDGLAGLSDSLSDQMSLVDSLLGPVSPELCARFAMPENCQLSSIPAIISIAAQGTSVRIQGGLGMASSIVESFLNEYSQWPGALAAWGQADAPSLRKMMVLHTEVFNAVQRTPSVAAAQGSALLGAMVAALDGRETDSRANRASLVVFVGTPANMANVAALLNIHWQASGYVANAIPPGTVLALELWERQGRQEIRAAVFAQSLESLHSSQLTANAQSLVPFTVRVGDDDDATVSSAVFHQRVADVLRHDCMPRAGRLPRIVPAGSEKTAFTVPLSDSEAEAEAGGPTPDDSIRPTP